MNSAAKAAPSSEVRERHGAAEYGFWFFLAIAVGRVNQLIPGLSSLPLAKLAIVIAGGAFLFEKRRALPALSTDGRGLLRAGMGIACLAVLLTPISIWPGSSAQFVLYELPPLAVAVAMASSMRRSWKSLQGTLIAVLLCGFGLGTMAVLHHANGRADAASSEYDPNDLAYVLVTIVPLGLAFFSVTKSAIRKVLYAIVTLVSITALLLTESRGGLLGFAVVLVLTIFLPLGVAAPGTSDKYLRSARASLAAVLVIVGAGSVVWGELPRSAQERYMTLLHISHDYNSDLTDRGGRESIWLRGLHAFVARPIGYGPQTYQMVDLRYGGTFKAPHNSYLEALVELGPLGLGLLLRAYFLALRALQRTRSSMLARRAPSTEQVERAVLARALQYSLIGNMVSGFFLSDSYTMLPWTMFGLTAALSAVPVEQPEQLGQPKRRRPKLRTPARSRDSDGSTHSPNRLGKFLPIGRHARPR